jgi:iron complex outermembrane receptor protein
MTTTPRRSALALAATLALLPTLAGAQAPAPAAAAASAPSGETQLPAVPVRASAGQETATGPVTGYNARRSATATKTDTPLNEVPQSISVITADQVRDQNAQTMQEVLRYTAGVRSDMYGLDNRGDWFSLRGGSEGSVLLDGMRLPLTGWWGDVRNEPYAFERIEVLRGPASVIAGQNGPGGVVNLVSKRPQADALREIAVQVGNENHKQVAADLTGPLTADGSVLYRLVALGKDSGTQVDHADEERTFVRPSLTWKPLAGTEITVFAEYQKDATGNTNGFFPIEGTLRPGPHGYIPYDTFIGEPDWDTYGGTRRRFGWHFEQALGTDWTLRQNFRQDKVDGGMRTMYAAWWLGYADATGAPDPNGSHLNRIWYAQDDAATITNADLLFEGKLTFGDTRHTLLTGVDFMRQASSQRSWADSLATPLDVYDPVYGSFPELDWDSLPSSVTESGVRRLGFLLQDQIKIGQNVVVVAGLRHDKSETDGVDDSATSRNLGLVYLAGAYSPYVSYSESFEPVAGTDFDGNRFKPQRGKQVEAGVKWMPSERITASAAVYQLKETNRLTTDPQNVNNSVQMGEVTGKGVELEASANLPGWEFVASYTYMDVQQTAVGFDTPQYEGQQLSGIPKHATALWVVHRLAAVPGLRFGGGVRYTGETGDGAEGGTITPSVTLFDLVASYDAGPWRYALNVNNVADKTYIATCLERGDCWFGTQRKAQLSAAYRW